MEVSKVFKVYSRATCPDVTAKDVGLLVDAHAKLLVDTFDYFDLKTIPVNWPYCVFIFKFPGNYWQTHSFIETIRAVFMAIGLMEIIYIEPNEKGYEHMPVSYKSREGILHDINEI
jgi:hypothetical protein